MANLNPYLIFNGNCREAMKFYEKCLGGSLELITYGDTSPENAPPGNRDRIMHGKLITKNFTIMASDGHESDPAEFGDNVYFNLQCTSMDEIKALFKALGEKGKITMELQDTFWGAHFGMLKDQFGIHWMFNFENK